MIPANKAQDLLNVDVTPGGKSVKKRRGYGLSATLAITTSAVHGIYNFFDGSGNNIDLYFNDTRLSASINGGSPSVVNSTGTNGATYQCVDSQGFAYCANTGRTAIVKTNGVTATQIIAAATGTMVAVTQQRLVYSGFSEAPSRVDFSKANDFTTWTIGPADTDPVQFTIVSPGSHITHLVYAFGRIIWFKDSSFGYILEGQTQGDWQIRIIAPNLGTLDNTSVFREGILYFRGNDGHIYGYDGSNYTKLTRDLQGTISTSQSRTSNSWTQTSQTDWEAGAMLPSSSNFTVNGALTLKGWSEQETSSAEWASGTFDSTTYVDTETVSGNLQTTYPDTFSSYRDGTSGTKNVWLGNQTSGGTWSFSSSGGQLKMSKAASTTSQGWVESRRPLLITAGTAGTTVQWTVSSLPSPASAGTTALYITLNSQNALTGLSSYANSGAFVWIQANSSSTSRISLDTVQMRNTTAGAIVNTRTGGASASTTYALPVTIQLWLNATQYMVTYNGTVAEVGTHTWNLGQRYAAWGIGVSTATTAQDFYFDDFTISPQTFTYTSPSFDTSISSPTWGTFTATTGGSGTVTYTSQVSADNSSFDSGISATSGSSLTSAQKRYVKLNAAFNHAPASFPDTPTTLADFTLTSYSTGTFYSAVKNAASLSSWDSFTASKSDGGGSHTFYIRSSTNPITVRSSTPSWTTVSAGAIPTISTGTYFQIRDDMVNVSSASLPALNDFTQNWFEGQATDKSYATYFKDALWWSVVAGTGATTNNRILRFDFLNSDWYLYDIATNGLLVRNNSLYFGSASGGYVYKFGDVDNDNGSAINAYWRSKDFIGDSPFVDKELVNLSVAGLSVAASSATVTYTLNGSSATAYTVNLYDASKTTVRVNKNLPLGKIGNTFRVEFGNNAVDQPFEIYAVQYGLRQKPWIPTQ